MSNDFVCSKCLDTSTQCAKEHIFHQKCCDVIVTFGLEFVCTSAVLHGVSGESSIYSNPLKTGTTKRVTGNEQCRPRSDAAECLPKIEN